MGKVKYSEEMKLQTVKYVLEGGKSATKISKELGIDTTILAKNSFSLCSKALFCYAQKRNDPNARKILHLRRKYATMEDVKTDLYRYIEIFYNRKRLQNCKQFCTLGYMSPVAYRLANSQ